MGYTITAQKLQELNVLIDKGGHIPSEVSDALAALQAATTPAEKQKHFDAAVEANIKNGGAYSAIQGWHDQVKALPDLPPEPNPIPPPAQYHPPWANPVGSGGTLNTEIAWGDNRRIESANLGGFPPDGCVSVKFRTPAVVPAGGSVQAAEYMGPPVFRDIVISPNPADFVNVLARDNGGVTPSVNFPALNANTAYYANVRNYYPTLPDGGCSCTDGQQCNLLIQFTWPK